jgi:hypothetical protein
MAHATECEWCDGELIITPAYPVRDRTVRCCNCGREFRRGYALQEVQKWRRSD